MTETKAETLVCWLCGINTADSAEHTVKASDLTSRYGGKTWPTKDAPVLVGGGKKGQRIRGPKSGLVKFSKSLCVQCNTARSQPYDRAYEKFSGYLMGNYETLATEKALRFDRVYGDTYAPHVSHLLAYWMKNLGCAMVEMGMRPEAEYVSTVGKKDVRPFALTISISKDVREKLNHQTFGPMNAERLPNGGLTGVALNGMFEFRTWWKVLPYARDCGTCISKPVKKVTMQERGWNQEIRYHKAREASSP